MLLEILRHLIDNFGRWTLIKASEMKDECASLNAICGDLGLQEDVVENCIQAGAILRRMAARVREQENSIVGPV